MSYNLKWRRNWRLENRHNWRGPSFDGNFGGTTPGGLSTFILDAENGTYKVRLEWFTDVRPAAVGEEQRAARNNRAKESYSGKAWLLDDMPVRVRATMAKYAARGQAFLLALPHEELLITADSTGTVSPVDADELALTDWATEGQRVVGYREDEDGNLAWIDAVIQSVGVSSLELDVDLGEVGLEGGRIAPARPIYFEPEQDFGRFESPEEQWDIKARAIDFDYAKALASLDLGPITFTAGLENASLTERTPGQSPSVRFVAASIAAVNVSEVNNLVTVTFRGAPFPHTVEQMFEKLSTATLVAPTGTWGTGNLDAADAFAATQLTGGELQSAVGRGATLDAFLDKPVWDLPIRIAGQATDSLKAMTRIIDFNGVPYAIGMADASHWGRAVGMRSEDRYDWQWLKLFITTVRGRQRTWWYPSWRDDLPFVSKAVGTITVEGDVDAWYPEQRRHVQVVEASGTVTRAEISAAEDNGDGTWTLTIGTTLASSNVQMVSWLELCRFERDQFDVVWGQHGFALSTMARAISLTELDP